MSKTKAPASIDRITATIAVKTESTDCAFAVQLDAISATHTFTRQLYRRMGRTTKTQAELHAAIAALMAVAPQRVPMKLICNNHGLVKLLARDDAGNFTSPIRGFAQLSNRLRALVAKREQFEVVLDKDLVKPVSCFIGDKLEFDSGTMVELIASVSRS